MTISRSARPLLVALVAFVVAACGASKPEVARVGERDIAEADLRHAVALQRVLEDVEAAPACGGQPVAGESAAAACDRAALSGELLWLAVAGYADEHGIVAADEDAGELVSQLETQVGADRLRRALVARDLTRADLVELARRILTVRAVRSAVAEDRIGTAELRAQYEARMVEFATVQADHILLETQAEAERIYRRVRGATEAEFVALARTASTEPGADESGGELGTQPAAQFVPEFANAAVALDPGEISRPVQTQFGWHVIYLVDKEVTPFEEAKATLLESVADQEFSGWLEDRAVDLGVEVDPRYGRFSAETFSVQPARSTDPSQDADAQGGAVSPTP
jgi:peptidyl-prolyl cis-trans isomerase C